MLERTPSGCRESPGPPRPRSCRSGEARWEVSRPRRPLEWRLVSGAGGLLLKTTNQNSDDDFLRCSPPPVGAGAGGRSQERRPPVGENQHPAPGRGSTSTCGEAPDPRPSAEPSRQVVLGRYSTEARRGVVSQPVTATRANRGLTSRATPTLHKRVLPPQLWRAARSAPWLDQPVHHLLSVDPDGWPMAQHSRVRVHRCFAPAKRGWRVEPPWVRSVEMDRTVSPVGRAPSRARGP